ncbi:MAG: A/G-specific adenine glycosylase, partial [Candidatus Brocadiia bacterium]
MAEHCVLLRRLPRRLLAWYGKAKRQLPWRDTRDPYRVWLAEVMLQQTRVDTVIPYYGRFLARFPTLASVAEASCDEVLELWAGLGYYARARSFHAAARQVVRAHGGQVPRDPGALRALPGVGPYTAAAVLSIAYGVPVAAVDGNVARVLCRLFGLDGDPRASAPGKRLRALAEQLLPRSRPGDFNEAMMELGATLCTPRRPACDACCAAELCEARRRGRQDELPARARRKPVPHYDVAVGLVWRRGKLLLTK